MFLVMTDDSSNILDTPTIRNSAQLHGYNDLFIQYLARQTNWQWGVQQGFSPNTAFKTSFFHANNKYTLKLSQNRFTFSNNKDRSGERYNPWLFYFRLDYTVES